MNKKRARAKPLPPMSSPIQTSPPIRVTVIDAGRLDAITALARMGETLAKALDIAPAVSITGCVINSTGKPGIKIETMKR